MKRKKQKAKIYILTLKQRVKLKQMLNHRFYFVHSATSDVIYCRLMHKAKII